MRRTPRDSATPQRVTLATSGRIRDPPHIQGRENLAARIQDQASGFCGMLSPGSRIYLWRGQGFESGGKGLASGSKGVHKPQHYGPGPVSALAL
jgi:hypothetical protein